MIFWIFVVLTVLGIFIGCETKKISDKYSHNESENTKFVNFVYWHDDFIKIICGLISSTSAFIAVCMLVIIIISQTSADGERKQNEQRYNALFYKSQTESIRDEFGIVNKEYIDEVQHWNEDLAKYQSYSHSLWIGIFYPKRQYDGLKFIDLENIKMKEKQTDKDSILSNCHLCGGKVKIQPVNESFYIKCEKCKLETNFFDSKEELIRYWNKESED